MTDDEIPLQIAGHEDRDPPGGDDENEPEEDDGDDGTRGSGSDADPMDEVLPDDLPDGSENGNGNGEGEETEPVELLVRLAEEGEIDPWDIDVVRVTDKFLEAIDEVDAFLDAANAERVGEMVDELAGDAQFVVVSHRSAMLDRSERAIGVTMQGDNVSAVTGIQLDGSGDGEVSADD